MMQRMSLSHPQSTKITKEISAYRAIDLFAGIGGIRLGFEHAFGSKHTTLLTYTTQGEYPYYE